MLANLLPTSAIVAGAVGAASVFVARKIPSVEKVLDKGVPYDNKELPIPHIMKSANGFPLGYVLAPLALAIAVHKYL